MQVHIILIILKKAPKKKSLILFFILFSFVKHALKVQFKIFVFSGTQGTKPFDNWDYLTIGIKS